MGKLDIGVGDEFPVDEPPPPSPEDTEAVRCAREEWQRQKDEWRQRKAEWRSHRDAFREDFRARRDAFRADVRDSFRKNFGDQKERIYFGRGGGFMPRVLIVLGLVALTIALLPFLVMFGFIVLAVVLFFVALTRGGRRDDFPRGTTQQ